MANYIQLQFQAPDILSKKIIDGKLHIRLNWGKSGISNNIITKTANGFIYEDVGYMRRKFSNAESIAWEFELNAILEDMNNLTIIDSNDESYMTDESKKLVQKEIKSITRKIGSNYTPPKKKRK